METCKSCGQPIIDRQHVDCGYVVLDAQHIVKRLEGDGFVTEAGIFCLEEALKEIKRALAMAKDKVE